MNHKSHVMNSIRIKTSEFLNSALMILKTRCNAETIYAILYYIK